MRVLHLIDGKGPASAPTSLALLSDAQGRLGEIDQQVLLLGSPQFADRAGRAGLTATRLIRAPLEQPVLGYLALRRAMADLGGVDLIHGWSVSSLTLAALVAPGVPRVATLVSPVSRRSGRWLRMVVAEAPGRTVLLPISSTVRRSLLSCGLAEDAVHVVRPAIDMSRVSFTQRQVLRERWGVTENEKVGMLLADPSEKSGAMVAVLGAALADSGRSMEDLTIRVLVSARHTDRLRLRRMVKSLGQRRRVIFEAQTGYPWLTLPACDFALACGGGAGGLSLLWAMAANVPIIGEASYAVSEIVEDRHSALLAPPEQPAALARRMEQLLWDSQLSWQLRDTARHEAYSFFSRRRYCESVEQVYRQVVDGSPVVVPPLPVTGGMRFSGRVAN